MDGRLSINGQHGSYPETDPKTRLRRDYFCIADDTHSIRPKHLKSLVLLGICEVKRDCSYLPIGTLRRTSRR